MDILDIDNINTQEFTPIDALPIVFLDRSVIYFQEKKMKKFVIHFLICFYAINAYSQITTTSVAEHNNTQNNITEKYNGEVNFLGYDALLYLGEELYINGKHKDLRKYGYRNFSRKLPISPLQKTTPYNELNGKYFIVEDVIEYKNESGQYSSGEKYYFKLREKKSNKIWYYLYDSEFNVDFPFISTKYFNYMNKKYTGMQIVLKGKNWINHNKKMTDLHSGIPVKDFFAGSIWECTNVSIEDEYFNISLILKNKHNEQIALSIDMLEGDNYWAFTKEQADYCLKFGEEFWNAVLKEQVIIGMNKELCKLSWGEPKKIIKTAANNKINEQWVYSDNYLYFENDLLIAIH